VGKRYIKVITEFSEAGQITPLSLIWDGQSYEVTKVIRVSRAASLKAGGTGYRYEVIIDGQQRFLWLEDVEFNKAIGARWFAEEL